MKREIAATTIALGLGLGCCAGVAAQTDDDAMLDSLLEQSGQPSEQGEAKPAEGSPPVPAPAPEKSDTEEASAAPTDAPPAQQADATSSPAPSSEPKQPEADAGSAGNAPASGVYDTIPVLQHEQPAKALAEPPAKHAAIESIVVTARRTAENMQDVPVAISAMSGDDLKREQITTPQDLQGRVPSLVIGSNTQMRNTETPTIRGQGATYGTAPGVVIYYGEVPFPSDLNSNHQGGPGKFFDLANVQVLKGSQGTLFGRNTTGGALLLEPHKPEQEFSASIGAGGSSLAGRSFEGVINLPLVGDALLMRAGGQYLDREGFTRDVVTGKDYDNKHYWSGRLGLTWRPTERVENYLLGYYTHSDDNGTGTVIEDINREGLNEALPATLGLGGLAALGIPIGQIPVGCVLLELSRASAPGSCGQDILDEQHARGHRRVELSADPNDVIKTGAIIDHFSFELADELTLRNIASWSQFQHHFRWDVDGSRAAFNDNDSPDSLLQVDLDTYTEELQLQGNALDGNLKYVLGGYYEYTDAKGGAHGTIQFSIEAFQDYFVTKESYAPFIQGTYNFGGLSESLSGLSATVGARYTTDKASGQGSLREVVGGGYTLLDKTHPTSINDAALTWTAGLDYKFDAHLVYGKVSRGYRAGGVGLIAVNPEHYAYEPEFVLNYELGQKSDFEIFGLPARVNSAIYYTDYTDLQRTSYDSYTDPSAPSPVPQFGGATFNVGKAWIAGFEFEGTLQPYEGVTLLANYGYTDGEYTEFLLSNQSPGGQLDCSGQKKQKGQVMELSCVPFQSIPTHQFSVSARYLWPVDASRGEVETAVTYAWTDTQYSAQITVPENEPGAWLPAYGLLNASLNWRNILGSTFDMRLYGTNLTDEHYRIQNSNQWNFAYFRSSIYSEPRIFGLQFSYRWE